jgi:hypothetical protein
VSSFKTSSRFGVIGVFVVMALTVVVALTMGQGEAKPKDALAIIFGILAVYLVLLFFFQTRDLSKAEAADARASDLKPGDIENPAMLDDAKLWAALAVKPIDADAVKARKEVWGMARQSIRLGMVICLLIFISVPPIYLFDTFVPLVIGAPLIAGIALWNSVRLLMSGGDIDKAYETSSRAMAPLGLSVAERPDVVIEPKSAAPLRMGPGIHGELVMAGERHGRQVAVRMPADGGPDSEVHLALDAPEFEFRARDGRLKAKDGAPRAVADALKGVPNSPRWNGVRGKAGEGELEIERKRSGNPSDWLLDLWLAERLAEALGQGESASPSQGRSSER